MLATTLSIAIALPASPKFRKLVFSFRKVWGYATLPISWFISFNVACPSLTLWTLAYSKPRHTHNTWHIQNPRIFKSSMILISLSNLLWFLSEIVPGYNYFLLNAPFRRSRSPMFSKIVSKIVFLKISQYLQGNTCAGVSFQ